MTLLVGYWGAKNGDEVCELFRCLTQDKKRAMSRSVRGAGWSIAVINEDGHSEPSVPVKLGTDTIGWVVGSLFHETGDGEVQPSTAPLDAATLSDISNIEPCRLPWGRFALAAVLDGGRTLILGRDALGLSRCYLAKSGQGYVFASRMAALVDILGRRPAFDWNHLASWMNHGAMPTSDTGFVGVRQVRPGTLLRINTSKEYWRLYWNPFEVAARARYTPSADEVRETFAACVTAWTKGRRVFVDLSGGLDSSAVAWAVRGHPAATAGYLDLRTLASADEYSYARMVANRFGLPLHRIDANDVLPLSPTDTAAARWDAPSPHVLQRRLNEIQTHLGGVGALHLSGSGGDQVFYARLESPRQLHDQLCERGIRYAAQEASAYSRQEGVPLIELLSMTLCAEVTRVLAPTRLVEKSAFAIHAPSWLRESHRCPDDCPRSIPAKLAVGSGRLTAGKARHAAEIAFACGMVDRDHRNPHGPPVVYPILSLPLVEMMLRAPISALIDSERDRMVFREAMASVLPRPVVARQGKGDYTGMYQLGLRRNYHTAKDLIIDGFARTEGIINPAGAIEDLQTSALGHSQEIWPLLNLLAVETWCQAWS